MDFNLLVHHYQVIVCRYSLSLQYLSFVKNKYLLPKGRGSRDMSMDYNDDSFEDEDIKSDQDFADIGGDEEVKQVQEKKPEINKTKSKKKVRFKPQAIKPDQSWMNLQFSPKRLKHQKSGSLARLKGSKIVQITKKRFNSNPMEALEDNDEQ